jgi:hypothetical protein
VLRLDVLAALLQAVIHGHAQAGAVAAQAFLDAGPHLGRKVLHLASPFWTEGGHWRTGTGSDAAYPVPEGASENRMGPANLRTCNLLAATPTDEVCAVLEVPGRREAMRELCRVVPR